jgi:NAD-dependent deacetylase
MQSLDDSSNLEERLTEAAALLQAATNVAVLTGAGVSAESGLATFRGPDGLWEGQRVEDVATPFAFRRNPEMVWRFYNARRANLLAARPNPGHFALAALEERLARGAFTLLTQNVDGLHRAAGSRRILELHGSLRRVRCTGCDRVSDRGFEALDDVPHCESCGALLRPDVVWFHEPLPQDIWAEAENAAGNCQCFLVIGTSAVVYPAAGLIGFARASGAAVIEINREATDASRLANVGLYGPSGQILPRLVEKMERPGPRAGGHEEP